ncbi:hypothetical protein C8R46DRAFT_1342635 [Mycena filopes]|nr:hypothetical protein C8R46DRAFT_1342635 [Mycena filopes]
MLARMTDWSASPTQARFRNSFFRCRAMARGFNLRTTSAYTSLLSPSSTADRIPNEIWLKALGFATTAALTNISTTSRRFCALSRPHIFAEFRFHPYAIGDKGLLLPNPSRMKKASDRLKFWLSDEIAPFVRVCTFTPFAKTSRFSRSDEPYTLLAAFFDGLVSFTGLQIIPADELPPFRKYADLLMKKHRGLSVLDHSRNPLRRVTVVLDRVETGTEIKTKHAGSELERVW